MPVLLFLPRAGARWRLREPARAAVAAATRPARARRSGCGDSSRRATATTMGTSAGRRPLAQLLQVAGELARKVSRFRELVSRWAPGTRGSSGYFPEIPVGGAAVLGLLNYFAGACALWWLGRGLGQGCYLTRHLRKTVQEKCLHPKLKSPERGQILSPSIDLDTLLWSTGHYQVKTGF